MTSTPLRTDDGKPNFRAFENYGFYGGAIVGVVVGMIVTGPNFHDWGIPISALSVVASVFGFGAIGHLAVAIAYGSEVGGGPGVAVSPEGGSASESSGGECGDGGGSD